MTELDIVNMALLRLGQPKVTAEEYAAQESEPCISAKFFYPLAVQKILAKHPWNFAVRKETTAAAQFGPGWRLSLPDNCLRLLYAYAQGYEVERYSVRSRDLLAPAPVDLIEYIASDPDMDTWPPLFVECVTLDLAAKLAGPICQSADLEQLMIRKLNEIEFPEAITKDAHEAGSGENNPTLRNLSKSLLLRSRFYRL